jgi:hypothetical protein
MCYALGRSARPQFTPLLQLLEDDRSPWVREQAKKALRDLEKVTPVVPDAVTQVLMQLSKKAELETVQSIAASKSSLLANYYRGLNTQTRTRRRQTLVWGILSAAFLVGVIALLYIGGIALEIKGIAAFVGVIAAAATGVKAIISFLHYIRTKIRIGHVYKQSDVVAEALTQLSTAKSGEIQRIAASQIRLLDSYYNAALAQAKASFRWALAIAVIGAFFFFGAAALLLGGEGNNEIATVGIVGGAIVEVVSGINFFLYGRTTAQLASFLQRLEQTQRFMLANSICESLGDEIKQKTRADLVKVIATLKLDLSGSPGTEAQ